MIRTELILSKDISKYFHCLVPATPHFSDERFVEMSDAPLVNREVPHLPELNDVVGVPPVGVEVPVCELHDLADRVQEGVEQQVEPCQPDQVVWKLNFVKMSNV